MEPRVIAEKLLEMACGVEIFVKGMEAIGMDMDKTELAQLEIPSLIAEVLGVPLVDEAIHDRVWEMYFHVDFSADSIELFLDNLQILAADAAIGGQ